MDALSDEATGSSWNTQAGSRFAIPPAANQRPWLTQTVSLRPMSSAMLSLCLLSLDRPRRSRVVQSSARCPPESSPTATTGPPVSSTSPTPGPPPSWSPTHSTTTASNSPSGALVFYSPASGSAKSVASPPLAFNAASQLVGTSPAPFGALSAGLVATTIGFRPTFLTLGAIAACGVISTHPWTDIPIHDVVTRSDPRHCCD